MLSQQSSFFDELLSPRRRAVSEHPNGIPSSSPALAGKVGLRWVDNRHKHNPERVESIG